MESRLRNGGRSWRPSNNSINHNRTHSVIATEVAVEVLSAMAQVAEQARYMAPTTIMLPSKATAAVMFAMVDPGGVDVTDSARPCAPA